LNNNPLFSPCVCTSPATLSTSENQHCTKFQEDTVNMEPWSVEHRVLTYHVYVRNRDSVVVVQRNLCCHFVRWQGPVPMRKTTIKWVHQFRTIDAEIKRTSRCSTNGGNRRQQVRTEDNSQRVRPSIFCSLQRSAWHHSLELHLGQEFLRTILKDLHFHAYKMCSNCSVQILFLNLMCSYL
ncbi:hypothetical protein C0J52_20753, partial [Blattella germanica]